MPESTAEVELRRELDRREKDRFEVRDRLNRERLTRVTNEMIQALTSPRFVEKLQAAREAANQGEGMDVAAQLLSIESLREVGIDIPENFRMTSRVFEDRELGTRIRFDEEPLRPRPDTSPIGDPGVVGLGFGMCAGVGTSGICGCGGVQPE